MARRGHDRSDRRGSFVLRDRLDGRRYRWHDRGVVLSLVVLPRTVLLLIGGAAGDRWGLRTTMIGCDLVMSAVLVAYLITARTPISQVLLLAALALSQGIVSSFRMPAAGAFPRMFVPEETVSRAISLTGSVLEIASLSGPPLGGVVVGPFAMTGAAAASLGGLLVGLVPTTSTST